MSYKAIVFEESMLRIIYGFSTTEYTIWTWCELEPVEIEFKVSMAGK